MNNKDLFVIEGLAGEKKLSGTIEINGAKNAALKAMAAAVLFDGPVELQNIPDTNDIHTLGVILEKLGAEVLFKRDQADGRRGISVSIDASGINTTQIDNDLAKTMRASVVLTGPMLAKFGKLSFPAPGGCVIGARPIDMFLKGYEAMGAKVKENDVEYIIEAKNGVNGTEIFFEKQAVGPTETLMMTAVLANGKTILKNCAMEPEIVNVAEWLNSCGATIKGVGTPTMEIEGTGGKLLKASAAYIAIPDRIEAGSFLLLGALSAQNLTIKNCRPDHMEALIHLLRNSGVPVEVDLRKGEVSIKNNTKPSASLKSFNVQTHEYPGFATDLQAQVVTYLTQTSGQSTVVETIFEGRFKYAADLVKMGAKITIMNPREIQISGPTPLVQVDSDEELSAHDIRAGFAIVMACLAGKGTFKINNVHLIDRGYEKLEEVLTNLGATIKRVKVQVIEEAKKSVFVA